jgi:uncharacterized membrane protein
MADYIAGGRAVAAGRGWDWIAEGWQLFKKQAGMWIAIALLLFVIVVVLGVVPIIGPVASFILTPVFAAGVLACGREAEAGRSLEIGHLFAGFREKLGPLATVGALYLAAAVAIALVVGLFTGASVFTMMSGSIESMAPAALLSILLALLIMLGLLVPVIMAVWFAPALVMFHGMPPVEAMKDSFSGCLRNVVPFLVYGVVMMVFMAIASIPFGLGWIVLGPLLCTSYYTSYKDIYPAA